MCETPIPHSHGSGSTSVATTVVVGLVAFSAVAAVVTPIFQSSPLVVAAVGVSLALGLACCYRIPRRIVATILVLLGLAVVATYRFGRRRWAARRRATTPTATERSPAEVAAWSVRVSLAGRPAAYIQVRGDYRSSLEVEAETWGRIKLMAAEHDMELPAIESIMAAPIRVQRPSETRRAG